MKRLAIVVLTVLVAAACRNSEREADRALEAAHRALREGMLNAALTEVERGEALAARSPGSVLFHAFRVLHAEILLAKPDVATAVPLIEAALPSGDAFRFLHLRRDYL